MNLKKIITYVSAFVMVVSSVGISSISNSDNFMSVSAADDTTENDKFLKTVDGIQYTLDDYNRVVIQGYEGESPNLVIPAVIDGKEVFSVDTRAFENNTIIETVVFEDGIKLIGNGSFYNCTNLTSVRLPESIKKIDNSTFLNCLKLKDVNIPSTVTTIKTLAFYNCPYLTQVVVPATVKTIYLRVFGYCGVIDSEGNANSSVHTPIENFRVVGEPGSEAENYANDNGFEFWDINNGIPTPPEPIIPEPPVTTTEETTTTNPEETTVTTTEETTPTEITSEPDELGQKFVYYIDPELGGAVITGYEPADACRLIVPSKIDGYFVVGIADAGITNIRLDTVLLPDTMKWIGPNNFKNVCTKVYVPNFVTDIDTNAFEHGKGGKIFAKEGSAGHEFVNVTCESDNGTIIREEGDWEYCYEVNIFSGEIEGSSIVRYVGTDPNVEVPSELGGYPIRKLLNFAFLNNQIVERVVLPDTLFDIQPHAFDNARNLKEIIFPKNYANSEGYINEHAFANCEKLEGLILPTNEDNGKTYNIDAFAFSGCDNLTEIKIPGKCAVMKNTFTGWKGVVRVDLSEHKSVASNCGLNKNADGSLINDDPSVITVVGVPGTYVETFAENNGFTFEAVEYDNPNTYMKGDANVDGDIDIRDVTVLAQHIVDVRPIENPVGMDNSDILVDGLINIKDLTALKKYLIKVIDSLEDISNSDVQ